VTKRGARSGVLYVRHEPFVMGRLRADYGPSWAKPESACAVGTEDNGKKTWDGVKSLQSACRSSLPRRIRGGGEDQGGAKEGRVSFRARAGPRPPARKGASPSAIAAAAAASSRRATWWAALAARRAAVASCGGGCSGFLANGGVGRGGPSDPQTGGGQPKPHPICLTLWPSANPRTITDRKPMAPEAHALPLTLRKDSVWNGRGAETQTPSDISVQATRLRTPRHPSRFRWRDQGTELGDGGRGPRTTQMCTCVDHRRHRGKQRIATNTRASQALCPPWRSSTLPPGVPPASMTGSQHTTSTGGPARAGRLAGGGGGGVAPARRSRSRPGAAAAAAAAFGVEPGLPAPRRGTMARRWGGRNGGKEGVDNTGRRGNSWGDRAERGY